MSYNFTEDWFSHNIDTWKKQLAHLKGKEGVLVIELGAYEGRATTWLLDNILTGKGSVLIAVDTWEGSEEHKDIDMKAVKQRFDDNVEQFNGEATLSKYAGTTSSFLIDNAYLEADMIYIDASHQANDVLSDAVLSDNLLKPGGLLIFDDYIWGDGSTNTPKPAIDAFLTCFANQYDVVHKAYQVILRKKNDRATMPEMPQAD